VRNGAIHNALLAVSLVLTPVAEGDGGFAIVPGSHKANFPCPDAMLCYEEHKQFVRNPALDPGASRAPLSSDNAGCQRLLSSGRCAWDAVSSVCSVHACSSPRITLEARLLPQSVGNVIALLSRGRWIESLTRTRWGACRRCAAVHGGGYSRHAGMDGGASASRRYLPIRARQYGVRARVPSHLA
jgi:hypothetical protein